MENKKIKKENIRNIIFDLGGVLLNIDYNLTSSAFKKLGISNFDELFSQFKQNEISDKFETGKATEEEFYNSISNGYPISREQFDKAWNAMLKDFPAGRWEILRQLGKKYNLFLCSNTNSIHYKKFISDLNAHEQPFESLFNNVYYSHVVGLRKPNASIFKHILEENNILPQETLFLDDSIQHIHGADSVGLQTIHIENKPIEEIFVDWLN